ncbi:MAG: hypothetical protein ACR2OE_19280 [Thermomicrobiales bacterium]
MTSLTSPSSPQEPDDEFPVVPPTLPSILPEPSRSPESDAAVIDDLPSSATAVADLAVIRDLLLKAYPDVVPDLVSGDSTVSLLASVEPAREAYARVLATIQTNPSGLASGPSIPSTPPPAIPAGGGAPLPIDPDRLPASEKIWRGLSAGRRPA